MRGTQLLPLVLILVAVLNACTGFDDATPITPSAPSVRSVPGPPPPPAREPGSGTIAIRDLSPAPGAMLTVRTDCPAESGTRTCIDHWRGTFDVKVDREMTNAILSVRFYDRQMICGYGTTGLDILPAGTQVELTVDHIVLSDEFGTFKQPCRLPATTNRIEAELWSDHGNWTNTLTQEFAGSYEFSER